MADETKTPEAPATPAPKAPKAAALPEFSVSFTSHGSTIKMKVQAESPSAALKLAKEQHEKSLAK